MQHHESLRAAHCGAGAPSVAENSARQAAFAGGRFLAATAVVFLSTSAASAQTEWPVRVLDIASGQGIANVTVTGRTSRVEARTNAAGEVILPVVGASEDIIVHGHSLYNYHVGSYAIIEPCTVYLVPHAAFHKTPLVQVGGTTAPIQFQGQISSVQGPISYTLEVEIPPDVLPEPAEFWIAPVPAYASPRPRGTDALINCAMGLFAIDLRNASGAAIASVLPDPGIIVRFTPVWYPASAIANHAGRVSGTQYRLTATSQAWSPQQETTCWDPSTGRFIVHLRACSWWLILLPLPFLAGDTWQGGSSSTNPPPDPAIQVNRSDSVTTIGLAATWVSCGVVNGGQVSSTMANAGTTTFDASFTAMMSTTLGIGAGDLTRLLTRMNASSTVSFTMTTSGGIGATTSASNAATMVNGDSAGPGAQCYSGEGRVGVYARTYTIQVGPAVFDWKIPEGAMKVYCLERDPTCGEACAQADPQKKEFVLPRSIRIAVGDPIRCDS